jgi:beta-galactosidase
MYRQVVILIFLFALSLTTSSQQLNNTSEKQRLNNNWQFVRTDIGSVWEAVRPAKKGGPEKVPIWQPVTLPHSYNASDAVDPDVNYYQGPAWYKTLIDIENPYKNGRTFLHFEGAGQKTEVYVYTTKVGSHVGGYDEWKVDITKAVKAFRSSDAANEGRFKGKIPVIIRTDNSRDTEMIPSDLSDFNLYGGGLPLPEPGLYTFSLYRKSLCKCNGRCKR